MRQDKTALIRTIYVIVDYSDALKYPELVVDESGETKVFYSLQEAEEEAKEYGRTKIVCLYKPVERLY